MVLKNASVFLENRFEICDIAVEDGKIAAIGADLGPGEDCTGMMLLPVFTVYLTSLIRTGKVSGEGEG